MSRRPKNNHYHYAEKYQSRNRRLRFSDVIKTPRKAVLFALLVLLAFGFVSTTFAAYVSSDSFAERSAGSIIVQSRNTLAAREGTVKDPALVSEKDSDLALTGAEADELAETGTNIGSTSFYYAGSNNSWALTAMTKHASGYYSYAAVSAGAQFKVSSSSSSYTFDGDLGFDFYGLSTVFSRYSDSAWKKTSNTVNGKLYRYADNNDYPCHDPGTSYDGSGDNFYIKNAGYVLVWYANTDLRENAKPMITVVSSLPAAPYYRVHYNNGSWRDQTMTTTANPVTHSSTWTCTINLDGGATDEFLIQKVFSATYPNKGTISYKRGSVHDYYYNTGAWTCGNESTDTSNLWLHTEISGNYTFTINSTQWYDKKVNFTVSYPSYTVTTSWTDNDGDDTADPASSAPTPASSTVSISDGVTVTATAAKTGYEFLGWDVTAGTVKTGSYASGTALTERTTTNPLTVYPYGSSGSVQLQAVYRIKEYTVTYNKNSGLTESGTVADGVKQHNIAYTITSSTYTRSGYTQEGWSTTDGAVSATHKAGDSYTANANLTLYPVWSIDAPTVSVSDPSSSYVAGGSAISLTHSATTDASGLSVSKSFEIISWPNGAIISGVGTNASVTNAGLFAAEIPGQYTVRLTGTVTDNKTTNQTASASDTCTVTVVPEKPTFQISLSGRSSEGNGISSSPWKILQGANYQFSAAVDNPKAGYTYSWSLDGTTWNNFSSASAPYLSPTYTSTTGTNDTITFASVHANEETEATEFKLWMKTEINGQSAQADAVGKWYYVQPLIDKFFFDPTQKIYSALYAASINAEYNLTDPTGYTTNLYYSSDNSNYIPIQRKKDYFISNFESTLRNFFYPEGVKYFKMEITNPTVTSTSLTLHTTVGTANTDAVRPYYFINNVNGLDLTNYRVMAYWVNSSSPSSYSYQTAQDIYKGEALKPQSKVFRINLPAEATQVVFAVANKGYYGRPTYANGTFVFGGPFFTACTDVQTLGDENVYTVTSSDDAALPTLSGTQSYFVAE